MDAVTTPAGHPTPADDNPSSPTVVGLDAASGNTGTTAADSATANAPAPPPPPAPPSGSVLPTRASRITAVVAAGALGSACLYTAMVDPNTSGAYPQCPLRLITGVDCAMCGGMRATHALLGGDIMRAASQNLMVVLLAPLALWATAQWFAAQWGVRVPSIPTRKWMAPALLVAAVVFSVVRNLGFGPGPWLHSDSF